MGLAKQQRREQPVVGLSRTCRRRRIANLSLFNLAVVAVLVVVARPASAWVCSRALDSNGDETRASLSWFKRDLTFAHHAAGTTDLAGIEERAVIEASFQVWVGVTGCALGSPTSDITFTPDPGTVDRDLIGYDFLHPETNENLIIFRDTDWPHSGNIIALTTTSYSAQTGEIFDADIEFNSSDFDFRDLPACCPDCDGNSNTNPDSACRYTDLSNTAVHEIGHVLGLGHPDEWQDIDPHCSSTSTMCATANLGDTDKRSLSCDDRDAIVFKYPSGEPNQYCAQPSCSVGVEACGSCGGSICTAWSGCGFCAPPTPLTNDVTVTVVNFDPGQGGCNCSGTAPASLLLVCLPVIWRHRRRRR